MRPVERLTPARKAETVPFALELPYRYIAGGFWLTENSIKGVVGETTELAVRYQSEMGT